MSPPAVTTLADALYERAAREPDSIAFRWLGRNDDDRATLTYGELLRESLALAGQLDTARGERAVILAPPGLDYVKALFACICARVVAVPTYPPRSRRRGNRPLVRLVRDSAATVVLSTRSLHDRLSGDEAAIRALPPLRWIHVEDVEQGYTLDEFPEPGDVALLQYTSGSTAQPKGVVLTHANLVANAERLDELFLARGETLGVTWLPPYHDMGLIGGILQPIYSGFPATLMEPSSFLQSPLRWLRELARMKATVGAAPTFAYDLCVRTTTPVQRKELDLSAWRTAVVGAEPVRAETLRAFAAAFAESGFEFASFVPAYGLAESTLLVSAGRRRAHGPRVLEAGPGAGLVSCGAPARGHELTIVDPDSQKPCADGAIGEIWVSGPNVAGGYWRRPEETEEVFCARLDTRRRYLRTGDLGLLDGGELFVAGRVKDVIIVRGRNHHPADIEAVARTAHPSAAAGLGAAFGVSAEGGERVVVVQEVKLSADATADDVRDAIRAEVAAAQEVEVDVVLVKPGAVPRTTSGKVRRAECKQSYLDGVYASFARARPPRREDVRSSTADELAGWLREYAGAKINSRLIDERRSIPPHVVLDFGNHGLLGMEVPAEYGGLGLQPGECVRVLTQLAALDLTLALFVGNNNALGVRPILRSGTADLRRELLPHLARGRVLAAFGLTEAGAGSNPRAIETAAFPRDAGGWSLTGAKQWIGSAAWAGVVNVFAQLHDRDGAPMGVTGFAVRDGLPGVRHGPEALTMGMRGMVQNRVELHDVPVGADSLLGSEGRGLEVMQDAMQLGRLGLGAISVGGMKRCAVLMHRYAERRTIATGRLLDNPVTLERFTDLLAATAAVEALVRFGAAQLDAGADVPAEVLMVCKTAGTEELWKSADALVQLLGARGYVEQNEAARILRDARVFRIFEGPTEALRMFVGASVLHESRDLDMFLRTTLGANRTADRLRDAVGDVREAQAAKARSFVDAAAAYRWACARAGEISEAALLAAALATSSSPYVEWANGRFDASIRAMRNADLDLLATPADVDAAIARYATEIGDVEQTAGDEDRLVDPLLRRFSVDRPVGVSRTQARRATVVPQAPELADWIADWLSRRVGLPKDLLDPRRPLASFGLDSVIAVELAGVLEDRVGVPIDPTLAWDYPTLESLAAQIANLAAGRAAEPAAVLS